MRTRLIVISILLLTCCFINSSCTGMYRTTIFDKALQSERRTDLLFDADWKFLRGNANNAELSDFDDSSWRLLDLQFGGIYMNADIWLNGKSLGNHPYGYTGFCYDITSFLNPGKENILAVKVRNEGHNSRWYSGSGIYRHVRLSIMNSVYLDPWWVFITTPEADKIHANINISSTVFNESTEPSDLILVTHIVDRSGAEMAGKALAAYNMIPSGEIENTLVFCDNYGQTGALNYYNRGKMKEAYSFTTDYIYWLPRLKRIQNLILVGNKPNDRTIEMFKDCKLVGVVENEYAREKNTGIYLLTGAVPSLTDVFYKMAEDRKKNLDIF